MDFSFVGMEFPPSRPCRVDHHGLDLMVFWEVNIAAGPGARVLLSTEVHNKKKRMEHPLVTNRLDGHGQLARYSSEFLPPLHILSLDIF